MGQRYAWGRGLGLVVVLVGAGLLAAAQAAAADEAPIDARADVAVWPAGTTARFVRRGQRAGTWDVTAEAALTLYEDATGILGEALPAGATPFNWGALTRDPSVGGRLTVGRRLSPRHRVEVRGSWLGEGEDSARTTGRFAFRPTPGAPAVPSPTASATLTARTGLWSAELNWWMGLRCPACSRFDVGIGARAVSLEDEVRATNWAGIAANSLLEGDADNLFLGGQLMAAWQQRLSSRFQVRVGGKVLLGALNRDLTERDVSIVTGGATANAAREATDFGWGAEGEIAVLWRVAGRWSVTGSYTALFLGEVTRMSSALDLSQSATGSVQIRDTTESVLVHSLFVGVRVDI